MPDERSRFIKLLKDTKCGPTLLLSGDRHLAEVSKMPARESGLPFDLYEMTASGLSHAGAPDDPGPLRITGTYTRATNYGLIDIIWQKEANTPTINLTIKSLEGTSQSETKVSFPKS